MNIQQSMNHILDSDELLGDTFYTVFFQRCPEVQEFFADTNMQRQAALLTTALILVETYYTSPNLAVEQYLQYLGTKHHDRGIPLSLYERWCDAMLETLARFHGDEWDEALAAQWREAIGRATELMFEGYQEHFHV